MKSCRPISDGLGVRCERCGCWKRGTDTPDCPPYITRSEPDGARLPHIKTLAQNKLAHAEHMSAMDRECEAENAKARRVRVPA
jgi:hypothetical protein